MGTGRVHTVGSLDRAESRAGWREKSILGSGINYCGACSLQTV